MKYILFAVILFTSAISGIKLNAQDTISSPNPGGVTPVYIGLIVNSINEINAATEVIKADIVLKIKWNDPRLKHNSNGVIYQSLDKIWDPMLTFSNRLNISKSFPEHAAILNDGSVIYIQRIYGEFTQDLYFTDFPFDNQNFELRIVDISIDSSNVILEPDIKSESGLGKNITSSEWNFTDWNFVKSDFKFLETASELPSVLFTIKAERQSGYYILIFIIPLLLIIMMSWMVFWLHPSMFSTQISIATTSMLTLIAYRFIVTSNLPKISYMTRMDMFILGSSVLIFLTLMQSIGTATLASKEKFDLAEKIDYNCRWIFPMLYVFVALIAFLF